MTGFTVGSQAEGHTTFLYGGHTMDPMDTRDPKNVPKSPTQLEFAALEAAPAPLERLSLPAFQPRHRTNGMRRQMAVLFATSFLAAESRPAQPPLP